MIQRFLRRLAPESPCATSLAASLVVQLRTFDTAGRVSSELSRGERMKDVPVLTGNARAVAREPGWTCAFRLSDRMDVVIPTILRQRGWTEEQIEREMSMIFIRKSTKVAASLNTWNTVEDFQRTPWYRRYRPTDDTTSIFISYECMKILEEVLIPPSLRGDPYAHLRKRHLEDNFMNDKFSEQSAKYVSKAGLDRMTKGDPKYGTVTRKDFLEWSEAYKKNHGGMPRESEIYQAWLTATNPLDGR